MHVGITAPIVPGREGGADQFLMALLEGLRDLSDQEYTVVGAQGAEDFLRRWIGDAATVIEQPVEPVSLQEQAKRLLGPARDVLGRVRRSASAALGRPRPLYRQTLAGPGGFLDGLDIDVLHVPFVAHYERTGHPSVLTVHDLQHRHLPEFFSDTQLAWREEWYPAAMAHANIVVTDCEWGRQDIIKQYGVDPAKVRTVLIASPIHAYPPMTATDREQVRLRHGLPSDFALYPALTYGHKNHERLLEAVARLRDKADLRVHVVCPGRQTLHWPVIRRRLHELGLTDQVMFPGFIAERDLRALYGLAKFMIFPTLFEGAGLPALEALAEGLPLAASDIPAVREYAGPAAQYFDPLSVDAIAESLRDLWHDADRRGDLRDRGRIRARLFSPARMASEYRELYRAAREGATGTLTAPQAVSVEHISR